MAQLNEITFDIDGIGYTIGSPGKIEVDNVMPLGIGIEELLLQNQGRQLNSATVTIDGKTTNIMSTFATIDENIVAAVSQAIVRTLSKSRIPDWKQRLLNG